MAVPRRTEVRAKSGVVTLDFTEAVITQPVLPLDAEVGSGVLKLVTEPGTVVDMDEAAVAAAAQGPGALGRRCVGAADPGARKGGSGRIVARPRRAPRPPRPPRRTFWQWLTRQPRPRPAIGR